MSRSFSLVSIDFQRRQQRKVDRQVRSARRTLRSFLHLYDPSDEPDAVWAESSDQEHDENKNCVEKVDRREAA
jgi:hypothetical protein